MTKKMITIPKSDFDNLVCKVTKYESFLHALQMNAEVTMNSNAMRKLIHNACRWSYAHRVGNGELTEKQQHNMIMRAFRNLLNMSD